MNPSLLSVQLLGSTRLWIGMGLLVMLVACGQPVATGSESNASQAPVTLGGADQAPATTNGDGGTTSIGGAQTQSHGGAVADHVSFVDYLRSKGLLVEPTSSIEQPFLQAKGEVLRVSGDALAQPIEVQSYDYTDAATAAADASQIGPDGNPRTTMIEWVGPPHLFRKERLIAIYVGNDPAAISLLTEALGPQFAGR